MRKLTYLIVTALMLFIVGCGGGGSGTNLASLLPGHKYYEVDDTVESPGYYLRELEFTTDGKIILTKENNKTEKKFNEYRIEGKGNILVFLNRHNGKTHESKFELISNTSSAITLRKIDYPNSTIIYYKTKEVALKALEDLINKKPEQNPENGNNLTACKVSGDTVLVDEGQTCSYKEHTAVCSNNYVTVDNTFTGKTVTINGTTYTCN